MPSPSKMTASRYTAEAETGTHTFKVVGYSLTRGIGVGKYVQSRTFTVGGYDWAIRFYPDGASESSKDYVSVYLELVSENAVARARYELRLLRQDTNKCVDFFGRSTPRLFKSSDSSRFAPPTGRFCLRSELEQLHVRDDHLTIECTLTVVKVSPLCDRRVKFKIEVPPCDIPEHFATLLDQEVGSDVKFIVGNDTFAAHKIVLAARSPVFKALFYGQMKEAAEHSVTIRGIEPAVFRALLRFIYTGSLHGMDNLEGKEYRKLIMGLLVAADRYAVDRLKLICESILSEDLRVENVAAVLAFADLYNCNRLSKVCIQFIASSNKVTAMAASFSYAVLKGASPVALGDILENTSKRRKT